MKFKQGVAKNSLKGQGISQKWQIVLAFMLGGAVSSIAQDPSDTLFFWVSSKGALSIWQQILYWDLVPFLLYLSLFVAGFVIAKYTRLRAIFLVYFYLALILISAVFSALLPQTSSNAYIGILIIGTVISVGIVLGLMTQVNGGKK